MNAFALIVIPVMIIKATTTYINYTLCWLTKKTGATLGSDLALLLLFHRCNPLSMILVGLRIRG